MRTLSISLLLAILVCACSSPRTGEDQATARSYERLDSVLQLSVQFENMRQERIDNLKRQLANTPVATRRLELMRSLIGEYEPFISDSALHYIDIGLGLANQLRDTLVRDELKIRKADVLSHAGLFNGATSLLRSMNPASLSPALRDDYFESCRTLCQYQVEYVSDDALSAELVKRMHSYVDSVLTTADPKGFVYLINRTNRMVVNDSARQANQLLMTRINDYAPGTREYSILASILAFNHNVLGNKADFVHYMTESAISDTRGAIKENVSFRHLANYYYSAGDITHAKQLLQKSFADANFFSARMRNAQSSTILPIIDRGYESMQEAHSAQLRTYIWIISLLAVGLALSLVFITIQLRRLHKAHRRVSEARDQLQELNDMLKERNDEQHSLNRELHQLNLDLKESNLIKESYVGQFMEYSSGAINEFEQFRKTLYLMSTTGDNAGVKKALKSGKGTETLLREFYSAFDSAFLNIFPHFVESFNTLMLPEGKQDLREDGKLNTELRVFALIRLGITDSAKIAKFLRCSITTIYTYRSKTRKQALEPATFEDDIIRLGRL